MSLPRNRQNPRRRMIATTINTLSAVLLAGRSAQRGRTPRAAATIASPWRGGKPRAAFTLTHTEEGPVMRFMNRFETSLPSPSRRRAKNAAALHRAVDNTLEPLEPRRLFSVTATAGGGVLTVTGDANANAITVSRDAAGRLLVNN